MRSSINDADVERVSRALCIEAGDDPDKQTYSWAHRCTGHETRPQLRWMYWISFAKVALLAMNARSDITSISEK
ncbi:hypothetical protein M2192_001157 [Bradyrhizobium elkanii USDA 61]|nr:hypothetical protein [Bradyrhizobium elkanii]MCS4004197.1 hypothetical protein [Bradyrhizobium elkanii USDA 61]MCS3479518.1 hypothetical protein [Bradyrhizobium elkanii]MCS3576903.1 hypothetical protein [Bradyrhizobium elkanii]MCS3719780.1 hypothetical protein [Bradyrhizobium elkanii]